MLLLIGFQEEEAQTIIERSSEVAVNLAVMNVSIEQLQLSPLELANCAQRQLPAFPASSIDPTLSGATADANVDTKEHTVNPCMSSASWPGRVAYLIGDSIQQRLGADLNDYLVEWGIAPALVAGHQHR